MIIFVVVFFRPLASDRFDSPKPASLFSPTRETSTPFNDEPLSSARKRAERVITEDSFFDIRGARVPKSSIGEAIREFDDEVNRSGAEMNHFLKLFILSLLKWYFYFYFYF